MCLVFFLLCSSAGARTFTSPGEMSPGEYKYVENGDGTYTEYYRGPTGEAIRGDTYSAEGMEKAAQVSSEMAVDEGTTGQSGSIVIGSDGNTLYAAERLTGEMQTGEPYATPGEAEIGDDLIGEGVADDTLPTFASVVGATAGTVLTAGGVVLAGVAVGAGLDELVGVPVYQELFEGSGEVEPGCGYEGYQDCHFGGEYVGGIRLEGVGPCKKTDGYSPYELVTPHGEVLCTWFSERAVYDWEAKVGKYNGYSWSFPEPPTEHACESFLEGSDESPYLVGTAVFSYPEGVTCDTNVPAHCPISPEWLRCNGFVPGGEGKSVREAEADGYNNWEMELYGGLNETFKYGAFPAKELKTSHVEGYSKELTRQPEVPDFAPPAPAIIPAPLRHKIIEKAKLKPTKKEKEEEEEGKKPVPKPLIPPIEEGKELPNPENPIVPEPRKSETFPEYASEVEKAGFVTPESYTLPEADIDPETGPNDVAEPDISPEPGTSADPSTKIRVGVNPADAPPPPEGHKPIGPPTEPGIDLPHLTLLCTSFPFGVPCWLKKQLEAFSASSAAPVWSIGPFEWGGKKIPKAEIDLAKIEPIMEIIRPFMIIFGGIGIVFFFYKVFTGTSIGGNENPPGEVPGPEGSPQPDEDVYL